MNLPGYYFLNDVAIIVYLISLHLRQPVPSFECIDKDDQHQQHGQQGQYSQQVLLFGQIYIFYLLITSPKSDQRRKYRFHSY